MTQAVVASTLKTHYKDLFGKNILLYLWIPEHCMQRVMPRLMLAQRGSGWPQSQQQALPGMARTFCRALSPFSDLSFCSPPESRLPVDVDDFLSSFWHERDMRKHRHPEERLRFIKTGYNEMRWNFLWWNLCIVSTNTISLNGKN